MFGAGWNVSPRRVRRFWSAPLVALVSMLVAAFLAATLADAASSAPTPKVSNAPEVAAPGETVTTTGSGFKPRARGSLTFAGRAVGTFTTSSTGGFTKSWQAPAGAQSGVVKAKVSNRQASATLRIQAPAPPPPPLSGTERWSDAATWGGTVPADGSTVTVPSGKTVLLDRDVSLTGLQIDGTLVFEEKDLTLKSGWIMVHGKLQVGTEAAPFAHRGRIVLTGTDPTQNVMNMGAKVLGVMGGTLDLHGEARKGWTKLVATAARGSRQLTLEGEPGWRVGDRIAVSSTDYDPRQDEKATVTAVAGNTVTLDRALSKTHWGTVQTIDGRPVDERAEVALLSRNVGVEGEEASSAGGFGGQIMVMGGGAARVEGAELTRMGQKNVLRRYPIHFHMLGDAGANSYLRDTSIHDTANRCVTVHGTNKLSVQRNVCYDHLGHGFFFEDGAETGNTLEGNLGFGTREPADGEKLLPSDSSPATFWITNPDNTVRNNVAGGSEGVGFWYALPEHPTNLSTNANIWPRRTPLKEFSGNVAHSNDDRGLNVDDGPKDNVGNTDSAYYNPRANPTPPAEGQPDSAPVIADFSGFSAYKHRDRAVWMRGENHRLTGATLADNGIGATFASGESFLEDSLVVGETANKGTPEDWQIENGEVGLDGRSLPRFWDRDFPIRGYEFYDGRVGTRRTTFANFTPNAQREASGLGVLLGDAFSLHPRNFAETVRFVGAKRAYMPNPEPGKDGDNSAVFTDVDGSVTGTAGSVVTANNPFLTAPGCSRDAAQNVSVCPPGTDHVGLIAEALEGGPQKVKPLLVTRESDGAAQTLMGCCDDSTDAVTNLLSNQGYGVAFNGGTPERFRLTLWNGDDRWLRLKVAYAKEPKVSLWGCDLADPNQYSWCKGKTTSLAALDAATRSSFYYDADADALHLKIAPTDSNYERLEVEPKPQ